MPADQLLHQLLLAIQLLWGHSNCKWAGRNEWGFESEIEPSLSLTSTVKRSGTGAQKRAPSCQQSQLLRCGDLGGWTLSSWPQLRAPLMMPWTLKQTVHQLSMHAHCTSSVCPTHKVFLSESHCRIRLSVERFIHDMAANNAHSSSYSYSFTHTHTHARADAHMYVRNTHIWMKVRPHLQMGVTVCPIKWGACHPPLSQRCLDDGSAKLHPTGAQKSARL